MTGSIGSTPLEDSARPRRPNRWLVGGALVLGLTLGGGLGAGIGAAMDDDTAGSVAAPPDVSDTPGPDSAPGAGAEATISDACLRAVAAAQQAYDVIDELGRAVLDFDVQRLDEVVHELQPLQDELERGTAACRVDVRPAEGPTSSGRLPSDPATPPTPTTSPVG